MEAPSWLGKLVMFAGILTAIVMPLAGLSAKWSLVATAAAGIITAFVDGFKSFVLSKGWTISGALLIAGAIIAYVASPDSGGVFSFITPAHLAQLTSIGVILTTIGKKLNEPGDEPPASINPSRFST